MNTARKFSTEPRWQQMRTYLKLVVSRPLVPEYDADDHHARSRNRAYYR